MSLSHNLFPLSDLNAALDFVLLLQIASLATLATGLHKILVIID